MATIMHVDMDAFYAAVEILDNPEYAGKPLIVGGYKDSRRGVVSTCSYEARRYGIPGAMPIAKAAALCPTGYSFPAAWPAIGKYLTRSTPSFQSFPQLWNLFP